MKILLTNGDNLRTLSFFRALLMEGDRFEVHVAAERKFSACLMSRFCKHKLINSNPKKYPVEFLEEISNYCKNNKIDVLIPMNADELDIILKNRNIFHPTNIPFPDHSLFNKVKDKLEFAKLATKEKILTPWIYKSETPDDLEKIKDFPVIVKIPNGASSKGMMKVNNTRQLIKSYNKISKEYNTKPFVQQYLKGDNVCVAAICKNGKALSVSCFKATRQFPINHGSSIARTSFKDDRLAKQAKDFLEKLKWHGIAQFDVIRVGEKYFFLEMNPRVYTSISVTVKSGLNYPAALVDLKHAKLPDDYKDNITTRVWIAEKLAFFPYLFRKPSHLKGFFKIRHTYLDDIKFTDPLPTLPLIIKLLRGKLL